MPVVDMYLTSARDLTSSRASARESRRILVMPGNVFEMFPFSMPHCRAGKTIAKVTDKSNEQGHTGT